MQSRMTVAPLQSHNLQPQSPFWWLRWVPTALCLAVILYFFYVVGSVALIPLLGAFALAYLLNPIVQVLENRGLSRAVAATLTLLGVTLATAALLTFVIPDLLANGAAAGQKLMRYCTPENAARQRVYLRRYSPILDRMVGNRLEQVLRDPAAAIGSP